MSIAPVPSLLAAALAWALIPPAPAQLQADAPAPLALAEPTPAPRSWWRRTESSTTNRRWKVRPCSAWRGPAATGRWWWRSAAQMTADRRRCGA